MSDQTLNTFLSSGTAAERAAFTPDPPTPAAGMAHTYVWVEEDTDKCFVWDAASSTWLELGVAGVLPSHASDHEPGGGDALDVSALLDGIGATHGQILYRDSAAWLPLAVGTAGQKLQTNGAAADPSWTAERRTVVFTANGQGSALTVGDMPEADVRFPVACTIVKVTVFGDDDVVWDLWVDDFASWPPDVGDTITAAAKPTLSGVTSAEDSTLTGWTKSIAAGDVMRANIDSATATWSKLLVDVTIP